MSKAERDQKLAALRLEVTTWADRERQQLVAERKFLEAVLAQSLGGPTARADELSKLSALSELRKVVDLQ